MSPAQIEPHPFQFTRTDGLRIACTRWEGRGPAAGAADTGGLRPRPSTSEMWMHS
jgi:hypothetical protein